MEQLNYSEHYLAAKKNILEIYTLLNKGNYLEAMTMIDETIVDLRLLRAAAKTHIKDQHV